MRRLRSFMLLLLIAANLALAGAAAPGEHAALDPALPAYKRGESVTGTIRSVGSSTLAGLMNRWADGLREYQSQVKLEMTAGDSDAAAAALLAGTCDLAPMNRAMTAQEKADFRKKYGHDPLELRVALDALAVFVNKDNPIQGLSMSQLESIFSSTPARGGSSIESWGQLGLAEPWASRRIVCYGFGPQSEANSLFRELALDGGQFKAGVKSEPGSSSIVNGVGANPAGIGYAGQFFASKRTRAVGISQSDGGPFVPLEYRTLLDGSYPLGRWLHAYVNVKPGEKPSPVVGEFLTFVLSREGQSLAAQGGNFPIGADLAVSQRKAIGR